MAWASAPSDLAFTFVDDEIKAYAGLHSVSVLDDLPGSHEDVHDLNYVGSTVQRLRLKDKRVRNKKTLQSTHNHES